MSGFPPIQIFLLCIAFAILAIPLSHLTGIPDLPAHAAHVEQHPSGVQKDDASVPAVIRLRYAHRPLTISLKQEGKELLNSPDLSAMPVEVRASMKVANKGAETLLVATWPPGTPDTALTVELEPDGLDTRSETRWSSAAQLNEVITFQW